MEEEIWKDYPGWEGYYQVSSEGRVKSLARTITNKRGAYKFIPERLLKLTPNLSGYIVVSLSRNNVEDHYGVHFMVAKTFVYNDNPTVKTEVNHINECKTDNRFSNLEWVSRSQNVKHGTAIKRAMLSRIKGKTKNAEHPVVQQDKSGAVIAYFDSISKASRATDISITAINNCLCGRSCSAGGYIWKYKTK